MLQFRGMPTIVRYLTHPQVEIDPAVPVPRWGLSAVGLARVQALAAAGWLRGTTQVVSSSERKAIETATPLAEALNASLEVRAAMGENDRSATGYLPPDDFEAMANAFFARPWESVHGWERAIDAQTRIVCEVDDVLACRSAGDVLLVGHGAVGTLLLCNCAQLEIDRRHDQPAGGGAIFAFDADTRRVIHAWRRIEDHPAPAS